jgi:hypothetical protein
MLKLKRDVEMILNNAFATASISFGIALVAGRKRVPNPATGKTALRTGLCVIMSA